MSRSRAPEQNPPEAASRLQFWAVQTQNGMVAFHSAGYRQDCGQVITCPKGYGFVIDVYPDEIGRYARDFARRKALILGKFDSPKEAYARLERWAGRAVTAGPDPLSPRRRPPPPVRGPGERHG